MKWRNETYLPIRTSLPERQAMSVKSDEDDEYLAMVEGQRARALATIERVKALIPKWVSDRATYPLDDIRASVAFIAVKACGIELAEALGVEPVSKAPSSPVETPAGSEQRPDHTGVIRPAEQPERTNAYLDAISAVGRNGIRYDSEHWVRFSTRRLIAAACMAVADAEHAALTAEVERLTDERDFAYAHVDSWKAVLATTNAHVERLAAERDDARHEVAMRDASTARLWAQLNEATNVPAHYSVEGAAGPCQSCDQPASTHYHLIGGGCMNSEINAADDRRAQ